MIVNLKRRKILIPIFNRAHYGRLRPVLRAIKNHPRLDLKIIVGLPAVYDSLWLALKHSRPSSWSVSLLWYVRARLSAVLGLADKMAKNDFQASHLIKDGFQIDSWVPMFLDGGVSETMAKSVGLGIIRLVDELKLLKPDIVFVNADRFEMMALAVAAAYLNIPLVHNEAGDVSGTIDESIRHAITKLAHMHFTSTESSRRRVVQMGENPELVFNVGSPAIDTVKDLNINEGWPAWRQKLGDEFILVLLHPVATVSEDENFKMAESLIDALGQIRHRTIWLGSNIDAGSGAISRAIKKSRQSGTFSSFIIFEKNLSPNDFYRVLAKASCAIGNSSSFVREGAYFGTPVVLIGSRQNKRERGDNIKEVGANAAEIVQVAREQLSVGRYPQSFIFGDGNSASKMADTMATVGLNIQKTFHDLS